MAKNSDGYEAVDVGVVGSLPAGTNNIGDVDVLTLPEINSAGKTAVKVTAAGAGDQTVKATAGKVYAIYGVVAVSLKDDAVTRYAIAAGSDVQFSAPITCGTSIILTFGGAGDAYIIYE